MACLEFVLRFVNPSNLKLIYISFLVQVGNKAFANYIDAHVNVTHINNKSAPYFYFWSNKNLITFFLDAFVERISFPSFQVRLSKNCLFLLYFKIPDCVSVTARPALKLPSPIWGSTYHGKRPMGFLSR